MGNATKAAVKAAKAEQVTELKEVFKTANTVVVVRFKGVSDRNAAEALAGTELFVDRSMLPDDGEEDEFYHADLVGLEVRDDTGTAIGKVVAVHNFGGGDILDVTLAGRKGVLIPFTQAAVPQVSIAEGFVRVDPAAAGLIEDEDGEAQERDSNADTPV